MPIIPDEARTFGMESMFRERGIYAPQGQLYKPVDSDVLMYYKEAQNGQILEEGITEAGSMASFTAAGTAYANVGIPMIPFFIYYSMFGFQRVGDLAWAFADARGKGFMVGGTAAGRHCWVKACNTRTAIALCWRAPFRHCQLRPGIRLRDCRDRTGWYPQDVRTGRNSSYYLTVCNENYVQPPMPEGNISEGILRGLYPFKRAENGPPKSPCSAVAQSLMKP